MSPYVNRCIVLPECNEGGGEVLMQLTNEAVATSNLATGKVSCQRWINHRGSMVLCREYSSVAVSSLNGGPIKNKNNQQQGKRARKASAVSL